jgi:hypothetical protein
MLPVPLPRPRAIGPFLAGLIAALSVAGPSPAAPATDSFNVELVVFRYEGAVASEENWDVAVPANAAPSADAGAAPDAIRPLSPAQFQLTGTESALRRNPNYEPIAHFGFRVTPGDRDTGTPVHIESLVDAASGLTGTVTLERGRFLHLALDLAYTTSTPPARLLAPNAAPGPVTFWIHQDRRMKPFERHYFDHPAFGVVAIVTPVGGSD